MNNKILLPLFLITFGIYLFVGCIWTGNQGLNTILASTLTAFTATLLLINIYLLIYEQTKNLILAIMIALIIGMSAPILIYSTQMSYDIFFGLLIIYFFRKVILPSKNWYDYLLLLLSISIVIWTRLQYPASPTFNITLIGQGFLALFIDRTFGLLPYAPVYLFSFAGLYFLFKQNKKIFWMSLAVFLSIYLVASAGAIYIGWAPPGRFVVPVIALLALPIAYAYQNLKTWSKILFYLLVAWSWATGIFLIRHPDINYSLASPKFLNVLNLNYSIPIIFPKLLVVEQYPKLNARSVELVLFWLIIITVLTLLIVRQGTSQRKSQR